QIALLPQLGAKRLDAPRDLLELGRVVLLVRREVVPLAVVAATVLRLVRVVRRARGAKLRDHRVARELGLRRRFGLVRLAPVVALVALVALLGGLVRLARAVVAGRRLARRAPVGRVAPGPRAVVGGIGQRAAGAGRRLLLRRDR